VSTLFYTLSLHDALPILLLQSPTTKGSAASLLEALNSALKLFFENDSSCEILMIGILEDFAILAISAIESSAKVAANVKRLQSRSEEHTSELQSLRHLVC